MRTQNLFRRKIDIYISGLSINNKEKKEYILSHFQISEIFHCFRIKFRTSKIIL